MRKLITTLMLTLGLLPMNGHAQDTLDFDLRPLLGEDTVNLKQAYAGKVILVVNTASKCGYTGQYEGLQKLYDDYKDQGLVILGFPSNDFFRQEPGTEEEIAEFCKLNYGVSFPMFEKISVKGKNAHPFYQHLTTVTGKKPGWNFNKYLIDREGNVVGHFKSGVKPQDKKLLAEIDKLL